MRVRRGWYFGKLGVGQHCGFWRCLASCSRQILKTGVCGSGRRWDILTPSSILVCMVSIHNKINASCLYSKCKLIKSAKYLRPLTPWHYNQIIYMPPVHRMQLTNKIVLPLNFIYWSFSDGESAGSHFIAAMVDISFPPFPGSIVCSEIWFYIFLFPRFSN
jgi:hypothetical protein